MGYVERAPIRAADPSAERQEALAVGRDQSTAVVDQAGDCAPPTIECSAGQDK